MRIAGFISDQLTENPGIRYDDIKKILDEIEPMPGLENAISYLKRKGIMSVIVSGGILWLAERLVKDFGIDEAYANDIMVEASMGRFIKGYSCSEISMQLGNGISERHVRNISNMAE